MTGTRMDRGRADGKGLAEHSVGNDCFGRRVDRLPLTVSGCGDSLHSCTWSEKAVLLAEMMPGLSEHCQYIRRLVPQGSWSRDARFPAVGSKEFLYSQNFLFSSQEYLKLNSSEESCHFFPDRKLNCLF